MTVQFYTYLHCKPDGTPFYVGKGSKRRCFDFHTGRCDRHREIVAEHGRDNILVLVFQEESEDAALESEIKKIKKFREDGVDLVNILEGLVR